MSVVRQISRQQLHIVNIINCQYLRKGYYCQVHFVFFCISLLSAPPNFDQFTILREFSIWILFFYLTHSRIVLLLNKQFTGLLVNNLKNIFLRLCQSYDAGKIQNIFSQRNWNFEHWIEKMEEDCYKLKYLIICLLCK